MGIAIIICLAVLCGMYWIGFHVTGALLKVAIWLFFKLPIALILSGLGLGLCLSIIMIPVGKGCFRLAGDVLG